MSKSFPEWWKHGQKVRTASDGILTLNIAEDAEYWLTNNAGKEVSVFSMDILGPASVPEACGMTTDITELAQEARINAGCGEYLSPAETMELVEALEKAQETITQLESRTVKLPDDEDGQAYGFGKWANRKLPATAGTMTIAYCEDAWRAAFEVFSSAAGIKVEAE
ncbi:hypothetical protein [Klebsiella quasipneumoniae]|uniref:hypothetical protein n=1 Tax=Klebsiella quasipneumoniae TaxID=1463165 RepID=UPI002B05D01C|nr:hypothetical protein [Klebsiella quasipneumoniae]